MDSPRILFRNQDQSLCVLVPVSFEMSAVHAAAQSVVPEGEPYLIVDNSDLPEASMLEAWDADFTNPSGLGRPK